MKRWLLIENSPALSQQGWLPSADAWPELAHLREKHERLLALVREETLAANEVRKRHEAEDASRGETMKAAFLDGGDFDADGRTPAEERDTELAEATLRAEAATDAFVDFLASAIVEIKEKAPEWYALLASRRAEAEAKRGEARRILAEADAQVAETERMRVWLDRESGRSALGHFPFEQMDIPTREPDLVHAQSAIEEVSDAA
jgi:hypothetical protein